MVGRQAGRQAGNRYGRCHTASESHLGRIELPLARRGCTHTTPSPLPPSCRRLLWNLLGRAPERGATVRVTLSGLSFCRVFVSVSGLFCDAACAPSRDALMVVLSVGLPSGDPLGVPEGLIWSHKQLIRTRSCGQTKTIYRENSLYDGGRYQTSSGHGNI